jgi:uncharacterized membrane protein YvbJ
MAKKVKCVHCGTMVDEFVTECPKCGKPVANKWAPTGVTEAPWKWTRAKKKMNPLIPIAAVVGVLALAGIIYYVMMK